MGAQALRKMRRGSREVEVHRVDAVLDYGVQLSAGIDLGQAEGGFFMALGWLLTEEIRCPAWAAVPAVE